MARRFLVPLGLLQRTSDPTGTAAGEIYYNTNTDKLRIYDGAAWADVSSGSGAAVTVSDTAPSTPSNEDIWFDSVNTRTYIYYNDGNSSQWVEASSPVAAVGLLDGGSASSTYGGIASINAGSA